MAVKIPSIKELFEADVHLGHPVRRWNPKMEPFIYDVHKNVHIIDLEKTHKKLKEASEFLFDTAKRDGQVIFVGTKRQISEMIQREAERANALYVNERWLGGTITNYSVIKERIDTLVQMRKKREAGEYDIYTKKERLLLDREIEKLERSVGGLVGIKGLPNALIIIDAHREKTAVKEAKKRDVPIVALIDTDTDPTGIDYPIPGNDDAIKSIALIIKTLSSALEDGRKAFLEKASEEEKNEKNAKKDMDSQKSGSVKPVSDQPKAEETKESSAKVENTDQDEKEVSEDENGSQKSKKKSKKKSKASEK